PSRVPWPSSDVPCCTQTGANTSPASSTKANQGPPLGWPVFPGRTLVNLVFCSVFLRRRWRGSRKILLNQVKQKFDENRTFSGPPTARPRGIGLSCPGSSRLRSTEDARRAPNRVRLAGARRTAEPDHDLRAYCVSPASRMAPTNNAQNGRIV